MISLFDKKDLNYQLSWWTFLDADTDFSNFPFIQTYFGSELTSSSVKHVNTFLRGLEEEEEEEEEDNLRGGLEILFFLRETIVFSLLISFLCLS